MEAITHDFQQVLALILNLVLKVCLSLVDILLHSWLLHAPLRIDHGAVSIVHVLGHRSVGPALLLKEAVLDFLDFERVRLEVVIDLMLTHLHGYDSLLLFLALDFIRPGSVSVKCHIWAVWSGTLLVWQGFCSILVDDDDVALIGV